MTHHFTMKLQQFLIKENLYRKLLPTTAIKMSQLNYENFVEMCMDVFQHFLILCRHVPGCDLMALIINACTQLGQSSRTDYLQYHFHELNFFLLF